MGEELGKIKTALHLMNSMILSGEAHSTLSAEAYMKAASALKQLEARHEPAQVRVKPEAVEALASYQQADEEGIMVLVSRQAIEECLPALRATLEPDTVVSDQTQADTALPATKPPQNKGED